MFFETSCMFHVWELNILIGQKQTLDSLTFVVSICPHKLHFTRKLSKNINVCHLRQILKHFRSKLNGYNHKYLRLLNTQPWKRFPTCRFNEHFNSFAVEWEIYRLVWLGRFIHSHHKSRCSTPNQNVIICEHRHRYFNFTHNFSIQWYISYKFTHFRFSCSPYISLKLRQL